VTSTTGTAFVADARRASVDFQGLTTFSSRSKGRLVTIRWEVFESGSNRTVHAIGSPSIGISDIDGNAPAARSRA